MSDQPDLEDRAARGAAAYERQTGINGRRLRDELGTVAPDLAEHMIAYGFGDVYSRPGLSPAQRQLVIMSILTTLGGADRQLRVHVGAALSAGLTMGEIVETFIQTAVYCGFPRAINGVLVARDVFRECGLLPDGG